MYQQPDLAGVMHQEQVVVHLDVDVGSTTPDVDEADEVEDGAVLL